MMRDSPRDYRYPDVLIDYEKQLTTDQMYM